jgi:hypothetical protein
VLMLSLFSATASPALPQAANQDNTWNKQTHISVKQTNSDTLSTQQSYLTSAH